MSASSSTVTERLPPNSFAFRLWNGPDASIWQVVGAFDEFHASILRVNDGVTAGGTCPISWLRGSARQLAEALAEDYAKEYAR